MISGGTAMSSNEQLRSVADFDQVRAHLQLLIGRGLRTGVDHPDITPPEPPTDGGGEPAELYPFRSPPSCDAIAKQLVGQEVELAAA